jgi:integrase
VLDRNRDILGVDADEDARIAELMEKGLGAESTRKAHALNWNSFSGWCVARGYRALPATPETVARYCCWLVDRPTKSISATFVRADGRRIQKRYVQHAVKTSTLRHHLNTIVVAHKWTMNEDPTKNRFVKSVVRGIHRERGSRSISKDAFDRDKLTAALSAMTFERLVDKRDRALILFGWSSAMRRSEIAAVDVEHITREEEGLVVRLLRSKTNQEGEDEQVLLVFARDPERCPIRALDEWLSAAGIESGPVFRLIGRRQNVGGRIAPDIVGAVTKRFARAAGLDDRLFAAHSLRSGWITTAAQAGRRERDMMRHSRHKSIQIFRVYVQQATKWDDLIVLL